MEQSTNPNSSYLQFLASQGLMLPQNANGGGGTEEVSTLSILNGLSRTSQAPRQQHQNTPSASVVALQQLLMHQQAQVVEEEKARAAALLALARNVSPDVLALALLRKKQEQQAAAGQVLLQDQLRLLQQEASRSPYAALSLESALATTNPGLLGGVGGNLAALQGLTSLGTNNTNTSNSTSDWASADLSRASNIRVVSLHPPEETAGTDKKRPPDRKGAGAFPRKLHNMLMDLQNSNQAHIASFIAGGRAFQIHQPKQFADTIMPKYFRMGRFSSFQRQLNLYCFERIMDGHYKGGYYHELFVESKPGLTALMKRLKIKGKHQEKNQLMQLQQQKKIQEAVAVAQKMASGASSAAPTNFHRVEDGGGDSSERSSGD